MFFEANPFGPGIQQLQLATIAFLQAKSMGYTGKLEKFLPFRTQEQEMDWEEIARTLGAQPPKRN